MFLWKDTAMKSTPKKKGKRVILCNGFAYIGCNSDDEPVSIKCETMSCTAGETIPFYGPVDLVHGKKIRLIAEVIE